MMNRQVWQVLGAVLVGALAAPAQDEEKVRAFPTTILIDPQGRLVKTLSRRNMFEELERAMASGG